MHKKIPMGKLLNHLVSSSGIRDMSRVFTCHTDVIQHRIRALARRIMTVTSRELVGLELREDVAADGLENFIQSQFFPTNLNVLVGHDSQFIYNFNAYYFKSKGAMTDEQKEKREKLYEVAQFEEGAASARFKELLDFLAEKTNESSLESFILDTDENPIYSSQYGKHEELQKKVVHRTTNSQVFRNYQNKLFPCNYIDRQTRKDQAEYVR
ncbi:MAG: hypothetical protein PQJ60_09330, partial [Spirochaetales bacterium]|nr:hypothetical protein [Spirochaetales bacterium]